MRDFYPNSDKRVAQKMLEIKFYVNLQHLKHMIVIARRVQNASFLLDISILLNVCVLSNNLCYNLSTSVSNRARRAVSFNFELTRCSTSEQHQVNNFVTFTQTLLLQFQANCITCSYSVWLDNDEGIQPKRKRVIEKT